MEKRQVDEGDREHVRNKTYNRNEKERECFDRLLMRRLKKL